MKAKSNINKKAPLLVLEYLSGFDYFQWTSKKIVLSFFVVFSILITKTSFAQTLYRDISFSKVEINTHNFSTKNDEQLEFDFYRAKGNKGSVPLIVFVHGGGFSSGKHNTKGIKIFAEKLAQRGYAVASVSYRLTMKKQGFGCNTPAGKKIEAINEASYDISKAIQHIIENNKEYKIDKDKIILVGSSAGAETVLNMAFVYDTTILPDDFKFAGVIGMAGAITTISKIDSTTAIPTQLFHGTADQLVPYGKASHHYCSQQTPGHMTLYGSLSIAERLKELGKSYFLYTAKQGTHDWAAIPRTECFQEIIDFLYNDVIVAKQVRQTERTI